MKPFVALLVREWREWRTIFAVIGILYAVGLVGSAVAVHKGADAILEDRLHVNTPDHQEEPFDFDDGSEWFSPWEMAASLSGDLILFGWTHTLRGAITFINLCFIVVALFYLAEAVFKERADGSTYFYRSLPVGDLAVLSAKIVIGTLGFLGISFLLGIGAILFARISFPGVLTDLVESAGLSLGQVAYLDLAGDWLAFHFLQLLWLIPFAAYVLFISTVARSRPLLLAVSTPLILLLLLRYFIGATAFEEHVYGTPQVIGKVLVDQWLGTRGPDIDPGDTIELFGSFTGYLASWRTVISLLTAGGFFGATFYVYRRNMSTS